MDNVIPFRLPVRTSFQEMAAHSVVLAVFFRSEGRVLFANTEAGLSACAPLLVPIAGDPDRIELVEEMMLANRAAYLDIETMPETLSFQPMSEMTLEGMLVDVTPEVAERLTAGSYEAVPLSRIRECSGINVFFHFLSAGLAQRAEENRAA